MDAKVQENPSTILLVEDNPAHAELILRGFEDLSVAKKIYLVSDGEAALDYLFRRSSYSDPQKSPRPRLILLDLRLPKIDGLEVLKEIRASDELKKTPVVILTTSNAERDAARAYEEHASSYLVKPLGGQKLVQLMKDIGFYWLGWNYYPWE